jgi:hypothetical protein
MACTDDSITVATTSPAAEASSACLPQVARWTHCRSDSQHLQKRAYLTIDKERGAGNLNFYGWREKGSEFCELMEKPEGNVPLGKPWHRWDDNIQMDLNVGQRGLHSCG